MAKLWGTFLRASCLCLCITLLWKTVQGNDCNIGFISSGWISPPGDLHVKEGDPWEMFCVLNTSHPDGQGGTWRNLSFYIDNVLVLPPPVNWANDSVIPASEVYNDTAIRLSVPKSTVSPNGPPHDYYGITCKQNQATGICVRHVYVGYPPLNVTDFQCTSYNWERLECTWIEPYNPIETTYTLSYQALYRSRRMTTRCPNTRRFLTRTANYSGQLGTCEWNEGTSPPYMPTIKGFNFTMAMTNELATNKIQYLGVVDHFAIVIPNRMENLIQTNETMSTVTISWNVPFNLQLFPPGLEFRVAYHIMASWEDSTMLHKVPEEKTLSWTNTTINYNLTIELPYANTRYNLSLWARSNFANKSDDRFWSQPAMIIVKTSPTRPCNSPETSLGNFEVINNRLDQRSATIRWSRLFPECENGPDAGYEITLLDSQGNPISSKNVSSVDKTDVIFNDLLREKSYGFELQSYNDVGYSASSSNVFIPMTANMPSSPENVIRIAYTETLFGVQWAPSSPSRVLSMASFGKGKESNFSRSLTSYRVFWCKTVRDSPVQCEGQLYNEEVPASQTSINVTVQDPRANYQFAVAANQGVFSSGMVWSTCIVIANGNGSQVKEVKVSGATATSLDLTWMLPCSVQNGIINAFIIYYCPVNESHIFLDEEPNCRDGSFPNSTRVAPTVNSYLLNNLQPYTMYKIVMSVETQFGEGQSSTPVMNRTTEGTPSVPLDLKLDMVTNRSLSISWREPSAPNGPSTYYEVFKNSDSNAWIQSSSTEATMDVESYTDYVISVRACNDPKLCSEPSEPISVKSRIGVPSAPGRPYIKSSAENSSCIEVIWAPPTNLAGPTFMSIINITDGENEYSFTNYGDSTNHSIETNTVCLPGLELKVRVKAVNKADNGELLSSPWSDDGEYQCKPEGLSLGVILGITCGAVILVLIVVFCFYGFRQMQKQKTKAQKAEIELPWDVTGNTDAVMTTMGSGGKQVAGHPKDVVGLGFKPMANFYGRLEQKTDRISGSPHVIDMKKLQNSEHENAPTEADFTVDRESRSSGHSSGPDSLSWHRASRSELSSSDSGAELEAPTSPSPDVFANPSLDPFAKQLAIARSSQNITQNENVDHVQYSAAQLRESQRNGNSAPDLAQPSANPYVRMGMAPLATNAPSQSVGYVTLGTSQVPDKAVSSPSASPNLSVGSNESLIVKSERDSRPTVKIVPLKRNSGGGSGYVEACIVEPASDVRAAATPGYVAFKSQEPVELDRPAACRQANPAPTGGYVTLGANSAGAAPIANATSTHYVKMGAQSNHSLTYV